MRTILMMTAAALALAACSKGGSTGNDTGGASAAVEPVPSNLSDDPQNTVVPLDPPGNAAAPVPSPTASPSPARPSPVAAIPAAFQGHWGMVAGDCDPSTGADKGVLTIAGNKLSFFESRGTAAAIRQTAPGTIAIDLPMNGEGQAWSEPTTLTLLDGGKTLVREAKGSPDRAGAFRYHRCPA